MNLEFERSGDDLQMHFPVTIATVPFRIPNSPQQPNIVYGKGSRATLAVGRVQDRLAAAPR